MTNGAVQPAKRTSGSEWEAFLSGVNDRPSRVTEEVAKFGEREGAGRKSRILSSEKRHGNVLWRHAALHAGAVAICSLLISGWATSAGCRLPGKQKPVALLK